MLSGGTLRASEMAGTAVFRIVVSNDSIKNATATSHGKRRLPEAVGLDCTGEASIKLGGFMGKHGCEELVNLATVIHWRSSHTRKSRRCAPLVGNRGRYASSRLDSMASPIILTMRWWIDS